MTTPRTPLRSLLHRALLSLPALFLASLAFTATPALAENLTHPLLSTCTGTGTAAGHFVLPRGVAVDEASEEVFVMDRLGDPPGVERFSFTGGVCMFVEAIDGAGTGGVFGEDVALDGGRLFAANTANSSVDVFEVGVGEHFLFSITRAGFQPYDVAVAGGVVYVSDAGNSRVDEFSASAAGEVYLGGFSTEAYGGKQRQLAVDGAGDVFVVLEASVPNVARTVTEVVEFDKAGGFVRSFGVGAQAVAVDRATGDVFVGFGQYVEEFDAAGGLVSRFGGPALGRVDGLAVDEASDEVFVTDEEKHVLDVFGAAAPAPSVSTGEASVSATEVTLSGVVNPESGSLPASYQFEYATEAEYDAGCENHQEVLWEGLCGRFTHVVPALAVSVGTGTTGAPVSAPLSGLPESTPYRYRIVGYNANADGSNGRVEGETKSFFTPGPPAISEEQVSAVGRSGATLTAKIDPDNLPTRYRVQYGSSEAYGHESAPFTLPRGIAPVSVSVGLTGLAEGSGFHARFVAENEASELAGKPAVGGDLAFATFAFVNGLPDGRVYELVTPVENHDAEVYSPEILVENEQGEYGSAADAPFQAAAGGGGIAYLGAPTPEGNGEEGAGLGNQYLGESSSSGWAQTALSPSGHDSVVYQGFSVICRSRCFVRVAAR